MSDDHLQDLNEQLERDAALFCAGLAVGLTLAAAMFMLGRWTA